MGNNIFTHMILFSHLSYTHTFISHPPHIYSNFNHLSGLQKFLSYSTFCLSLISGFPSSIFSPSLCLSHQFGYVQCKCNYARAENKGWSRVQSWECAAVREAESAMVCRCGWGQRAQREVPSACLWWAESLTDLWVGCVTSRDERVENLSWDFRFESLRWGTEVWVRWESLRVRTLG